MPDQRHCSSGSGHNSFEKKFLTHRWNRERCSAISTCICLGWGDVAGRVAMLSHDFLAHAQRCRDLASEIDDPPTKDEVMALAARWTRLAQEAESALLRQDKRQKSPSHQVGSEPVTKESDEPA